MVTPDLALTSTGTCSFCGKARVQTRAFVKAREGHTIICDQCLGLCCSILAEAVDEKIEDPISALEVPQERLDKILHLLATKGSFARSQPTSAEPWRCGFCSALRQDVVVFISGPRVFICETCVGAAATLAKTSA